MYEYSKSLTDLLPFLVYSNCDNLRLNKYDHETVTQYYLLSLLVHNYGGIGTRQSIRSYGDDVEI